MTRDMIIRRETAADIAAIGEVTIAAFDTLAISNHTEQFIIRALRAADVLTLSLVAEVDGRVVGHVAFSPVTISDGTQNWYGLGPVSVLPEHQRQGIGTALIREGLSMLKGLGAQGCCLVGDPAYYSRFGFSPAEPLGLKPSLDVPLEAVMTMELVPGSLTGVKGTVVYPEIFLLV